MRSLCVPLFHSFWVSNRPDCSRESFDPTQLPRTSSCSQIPHPLCPHPSSDRNSAVRIPRKLLLVESIQLDFIKCICKRVSRPFVVLDFCCTEHLVFPWCKKVNSNARNPCSLCRVSWICICDMRLTKYVSSLTAWDMWRWTRGIKSWFFLYHTTDVLKSIKYSITHSILEWNS